MPTIGYFDSAFDAVPDGSGLTLAELARPTNAELTTARHPDWVEHQLRWRFLLDSLEGGERYRQAIYGFDNKGVPIRNLIRHKREYPEPRDRGAVGPYSTAPIGADPAMPATDDDYELRRSRTPIPTFVAETIDGYLGRIFGRKVRRDIPAGPDFAGMASWTADVDGKGTSLNSWMNDVVGRVLIACGNVDVLMCHPTPPENEEIRSRHDELRLNLTGCVARAILPQNVVNWRTDSAGRYTMAVVQEWSAGGDADPRYQIGQADTPAPYSGSKPAARPVCCYRLWLPNRWILYDGGGEKIREATHPFGRVPIVRLFCRKKARCDNVGQSPVESIAERQREYYNRDSELILSDTYQAHPVIQVAEDSINQDGSMPIGPSWLLPKKKNMNGSAVTYEPAEVLDFPKGAAESIRLNKAEIRDDVDRDAALTKPAGATGTGGGTVGQSGVSKEIDNEAFHDRLCSIAKILEQAEIQLLSMAQVVVHDGKPPAGSLDAVKVCYPTQYSLSAPDQIAKSATDFQTILAAAGEAPEAERMFLSELFRKALPGRDDETYDRIDGEIGRAVDDAAKRKEEAAESAPNPPGTDPSQPPGAAGEEPDENEPPSRADGPPAPDTNPAPDDEDDDEDPTA